MDWRIVVLALAEHFVYLVVLTQYLRVLLSKTAPTHNA